MTRNGAVFGVCLLLAILLLILNKLSRTYIGEVKAQIQYMQLPRERVPVTALPDDLTLFVEASGFRLLWAGLRKPSPVQINLAQLSTDFIVTSDLTSVIASQLSSDYKLIEITPDTLHFRFDRGITKKIPVQADILLSFKKQYDFMEPLVVTPESLIISGPQHILDTIHIWRTERLVLDDLDKSMQGELALIPPQKSTIILKPKKIKYTVGVEEFTEKTLEVPIQPANASGSKEISIFPNEATIIFRVGLSNYEQVNNESFTVVADFSGIDISRSKYVPVRVALAPSYIRNLDYSPKSVEYIIYQ